MTDSLTLRSRRQQINKIALRWLMEKFDLKGGALRNLWADQPNIDTGKF